MLPHNNQNIKREKKAPLLTFQNFSNFYKYCIQTA